MIVREGLDFERGKDPKKIMDLGIEQAILKGLKELQLSPGIGAINLKEGGNKLEVHVYNKEWFLILTLLDKCFPPDIFNKKKAYIVNKKTNSFRKIYMLPINPEYVKMFQNSFDEEGFIKD